MQTQVGKLKSGKFKSFLFAIALATSTIGASVLRVAHATDSVPAGQETWSAKIDGKAWTATRILFATTFFGGKPVLNITAFHDAATPSRMGFNLLVPPQDNYLGSFALSQSDPLHSSHGNYVANAGADSNPMQDSYTFVGGTLTIEKYDKAAHRISGKFSGSVRNHSSKTLTVSEGSFANVEISSVKATP